MQVSITLVEKSIGKHNEHQILERKMKTNPQFCNTEFALLL